VTSAPASLSKVPEEQTYRVDVRKSRLGCDDGARLTLFTPAVRTGFRRASY